MIYGMNRFQGLHMALQVLKVGVVCKEEKTNPGEEVHIA
jgi:hypothetical protein